MSGVDNDANNNMELWVFAVGLLGGGATSYSILSAGADPGIRLWGANTDIAVDNQSFLYNVQWDNAGVAGQTMQLCGIMITYQMPITSALLPVHLYGDAP